jgi:hypothetical protein
VRDSSGVLFEAQRKDVWSDESLMTSTMPVVKRIAQHQAATRPNRPAFWREPFPAWRREARVRCGSSRSRSSVPMLAVPAQSRLRRFIKPSLKAQCLLAMHRGAD